MVRVFLKKIFLILICLSVYHVSLATHIAGGEIRLEWTGNGNYYKVILTKYINEISVRQYGFVTNNTESVDIFEKGTNNWYANVPLTLVTNKLLDTKSNYCTNPAYVEISKQVYSGFVDLSILKQYGIYYATWYDCCRNQDIINLSDPSNESIELYTEFYGLGVRNRSPEFLPPSNEYFCRNSLNAYNSSAVDIDGDKLVYSLVSPRSTVNPSVDVVWRYGTNAYNPIPGSVPFKINPTTGIITFNPYYNGIYVYGVRVEEYRYGVKIGEVRRDFQLNVQDCPVNNKPVIAFDNASINKADTLTVSLKGSTCFPIYITDIDASQFFISETIYLNTTNSNSKNGDYPLSGFKIPQTVPLTGYRDTTRFNACFSPCDGGLRLDETSYYPFSIVINDNRCPAQYDTLLFTIKVEVEKNTLPEVFIDPSVNPKTVVVGETLNFNVYGTDSDPLDLLSLKFLNPQSTMVFKNVQDSMQTIRSPFSWRPTCADLYQPVYDLAFLIKDNSCHVNPYDTVQQRILLKDKEVSFETIEITNLITPNGDGLNDCYRVPGIPEGNCSKFFKGIEIYNRWGSRIFYSTDRFFSWCPDESDGVYYFAIDLNDEVRKGWLQIMR